ncbi:MAG: S9 family peptidase [Thermoanaerobaculia bacterium]|nr:S9 family peptidase [Thermoanaerobaculia bacterium]
MLRTRFAPPSILWLLVLVPGLLPAADGRPLSLSDVAMTREVEEVAIAPSGDRIAYVLGVPRNPLEEENGPARKHLYVLNGEGEPTAFVTGDVRVSQISWRPGHAEIAFLAKRGDDEEAALWGIPTDGGEARKRVTFETGVKEYSFSPDGDRVAFVAEEPAPEEERDPEADPEEAETWEEKGFDAEVFQEEERHDRVYVRDLTENGEESTEESPGEPRMLELEGTASEIHWGPTGDRIALALAPTPFIDDHYMQRRVRVVDVETSEILTRVDNPGKLGEIAWSPDGEHLAILSAADFHDPREGRLTVVSASEGGDLENLLPDYEGHVRELAWIDESTLLYLGDRGVWTEIGTVDLGGNQRILVPGEDHPVWDDLALSDGGSVAAFTGETPTHPGEVFRFSPGGKKAPRRLTDNNPWLADRELARQEVVRFRDRADELTIEGLLIHPLEEREERVPLVLMVHGGPESHYRQGWITSYSRPGQAMAGRGFASFYINYRGSTGRGIAFSKLDQGDAGGREFDDLVDGIDHLVERGLADGDRVGITGGSYGGFASAWGATYYSDRYAASVMFVGISDQISKSGTTEIPDEMAAVHWLTRPWEDWKLFLERSPIYYVERARTPILIAHGTEDPRVHPEQSLEMYRYLKAYGETPVRLVWYPEEKHGNREAAARFDYSVRLVRWMEHYLKGGDEEPPAYSIPYRRAWEEGVLTTDGESE